MNNNTKATISSIAFPLILAFIASIILLVATGNPGSTLFDGVLGVFSSENNLETLLKVYMTPFIFTGVSVAFAFRGGLFNIGAEGQFMFGGVLGVVSGLAVQNVLPAPLTLLVALLGGIVGGAIMGVVPGVLKALLKVNEVVICIMMNYVALYLANYLVSISGPNVGGSNTQTFSMNADVSSLLSIGGSSFIRLDLILALLMIVAFYIVINKTTFGYELRASGLSGDAANYAGMNVTRNVVLTMAISGAISGLGGVLFLFGPTTVAANQQAGFMGYGFSGIAVALLGMSVPIGVILAAVLFAILGQSGKVIATLYVPPISQQISGIMTSFIVFFVAFQPSIKKKILTWLALKDVKSKKGGAQ